MKKKKFYIYTVTRTCTNRNLDAKKIHTYLSKNNYKLVEKPQFADTIILITCASIDATTDCSLNKVKEFQKYDAELIVVGCLPVIAKDKLSEIFNGKTINIQDINKIDQLFPKNKIKFENLNEPNILFQEKIVKIDEHIRTDIFKKIFRKTKMGSLIGRKIIDLRNRFYKILLGEQSIPYKVLSEKQFYIRIAQGCLGDCSYCVIKNAIGTLKSKPIDKCVKEFEGGLNEGYTHFVITADDVGPYGLDINSNLPCLLDELTKYPGDYKISIEALNPFWIIKYYNELEEIFKRHKISGLYIPIQSGNRRILKMMNRYSGIKKIMSACLKIKKLHPDISLSADIIVGFPTETEEEFKQTLSFICKINFNFGLIYRFSCNTGTEAEKINPKITQKVMQNRLKYAKKYLRSKGYIVLYKPIFSLQKWSNSLGFIKR